MRGRVRPLALLLALAPASGLGAQLTHDLPSDLPAWVHTVGARRGPTAARTCSANEHGARADTSVTSTLAIQRAIDACAAAGGGMVTFAPGTYLAGALFLKSGVHFRVDEGVTLLGSQDDADYPVRPTRVAGIEMPWPVGLLNVDGQRNVRISGGGTIDGRGEKWWDRYWQLRRQDYEPRGLRWAADYDAQRVRLVVISNSSDVSLEDLLLRRSGFWTVHVLYSDHVTVSGLTIRDNQGPSTDGIDIDSSSRVLVQGNDIDNNDDTICLKAGRDADGLRVNRPTEYVLIRDNVARRGAGVVSFGSETSGGIRHVVAWRNHGLGTTEGIRFKSAKTRGGFVSDVLVRDLRLLDVPSPITFTLDWNPSYSYASFPDTLRAVPAHWRVLATRVEPPERGYCDIHDITIEDVKAAGARRVFTASGLPQQPLRDVTLRAVAIMGESAGSIEYARNWRMSDVVLLTATGEPLALAHTTDVPAPLVVQGEAAAGATRLGGLPPADSILAVLRRANRYFMDTWPDPGRTIITNIERPSHIWTRAVYYEGLLALHGIDPQPEYYDYAVRWGNAHDWELRGGPYNRNADDQAAGQTYLDLYRMDPRPERIAAVRTCIDSLLASDKLDDWHWIDAIQMAMPVYAKLGLLLNDSRYWQRMAELYRFTRERHGEHGLFNAADGLWWRDADFDPPTTSPAGRDIYWSRGNGWVFMALARVLATIPESAPHRDLYVRDFTAMAEALRARQREDGFWNVSLDDPTHFGGPETSGTAMFAFGFAWGIRAGLLDPTEYGTALASAWRALSGRAVRPDGSLAYVQGTGKQPSEGQPVTYDSRPDFEDYALGAFLLAGSEVYRLAGGR